MTTCPSCGAPTDPEAAVCFTCKAPLLAVGQGDVLDGRWEIRAFLGRGGMGAVYRAHDRTLNEEVALKVIRPELMETPETRDRFTSEIKLARRVSHPGVCRIHEYGEDGRQRFFTMELVEGHNLRDRIRDAGPIAPERAATLAADVADALQAIHAAGIVHRDLKPLNIMLDGQGRVRLMDFGIAKGLASGTSPGTGAGYVVGSPEFMSPEQARGRPVDARSDIYALGIVLYEMLTGAPPFRGSDPVTTLLMHVEEEPALEGIPEPLRAVVARALAKDPDQRFRTAMGMAQALRAAAAAIAADAAAPRSAIPPRGYRIAGAALAIVAVAVVAWRFWPRNGSTPEVAPPMSTVALPTATPTAIAAPTALPARVIPTAVPTVVAPAAAVVTPQAPSRPTVGPSPTVVAAESTPIPEPTPTPTGSPEPTPTPAPTATAEAPATAPPPVARGHLNVSTEPWVDVYIDGNYIGPSPLVMPLEPGRHLVRLLHQDYRECLRTVHIEAGKTRRLSVDLSRDCVRRR
jgi:serine/threonine-protein kinase